MKKKLAQPTEPVATPRRMVTCSKHVSTHFERTTCVKPKGF